MEESDLESTVRENAAAVSPKKNMSSYHRTLFGIEMGMYAIAVEFVPISFMEIFSESSYDKGVLSFCTSALLVGVGAAVRKRRTMKTEQDFRDFLHYIGYDSGQIDDAVRKSIAQRSITF